MPNISKGPRLWKRPAEPNRQALWVVKDKGKRISTGCVAEPFDIHPPEAAEQFLADYIAAKYAPERKMRDVDRISLADVLLIYHTDQYAQLRVDLRSPSLWARLPTPVAAKAGPVPTHERLGPGDCENLQD